ncbi:MAG: tetratricopeptide repeat protein [Chloroflexi bacterium]|nr:MAG: tetratricopeptide repeat protein [Chloroflexota bacterium]
MNWFASVNPKKRLSFWIVAIILFALSGFRITQIALPNNLFMVKQLPLLVDTSYSKELKPLETVLIIDLMPCDTKIYSSACLHTLMASINSGLPLDQLSIYLEKLNDYPDQQVILASYAGEIWYRTDRKSDALAVWQNWLTPYHKIDEANRLYQAGQVEDALEIVNSLDLETRIESDLRRRDLNRIIIDMAVKLTDAGLNDMAENYWYWATIQYPDRPSYAFSLGLTLYNQGRLEEAAHQFENAISLNPKSISYQIRLAQTLIRLDRKDEARVLLDGILEIEPENEIANELYSQLN